jgi:hypothetical protein
MATFSSKQVFQKTSTIKPKKVVPPLWDYEVKDYAMYASKVGISNAMSESTWNRSDGYWLTRDRETNNIYWKSACTAIVLNQWKGRLLPFEQVKDFYRWADLSINKVRQHDIMWMKGAYYLVSDLSDLYDEGLTANFDILNIEVLIKLRSILFQLNHKIADYAIDQFHNLIFGENRNARLRGIEAYKFDRDFIIWEQSVIAFPVYNYFKSNYPNALGLLNIIFNSRLDLFEIALSLQASPITLFLWNLFKPAEIPIYSNLYNSDLTKDTKENTRYGQDARILAPIAMLYPGNELHDVKDIHLNTNSMVEMKNKGKLAYQLKYKSNSYYAYTYRRVNKKIHEKFK